MKTIRIEMCVEICMKVCMTVCIKIGTKDCINV